MELKGSKTEQNLMVAFAGESQARNKYDYYASAAKKEGYEQIAALFQETAHNEKEHAKLWFKYFHGIGTTVENLLDAAAGETTNGQKCMQISQKLQKKKVSKQLQHNLEVLQRLKNTTKKDIVHWHKTSKTAKSLNVKKKQCGFVATAVTYT